MMKRRRVRAICLLMSLAGCSNQPQPVAPANLAAVRVQLDSLWAAYNRAAQTGDAAGLTAFYADSGYFILSGTPTLYDRATLLTLTVEALKSGRFAEDVIHPESTEWAGDRVIQTGTYHDIFEVTGKPAQVTFGRFVAILQRDAAHNWKIGRLAAIQDSSIARGVAAKGR